MRRSRGCSKRDRELRLQMVGQGDLGRDEALEARIGVAGMAAGADVRPRRDVGVGAGELLDGGGGGGGIGGALVGKDVLEVGAEAILDGGARGVEVGLQPVALGGLGPGTVGLAGPGVPSPSVLSPGVLSRGVLGVIRAVRAVEERVALQLGVDKATRSRLDSCSSLIACISCGVITRDCVWRNSNLCDSAIRQSGCGKRQCRILHSSALDASFAPTPCARNAPTA